MHKGPRSVGIIMDGNRRWAKERGLPTFDGHLKGLEKLYEIAEWAEEDTSVEEVTLYAFSTENWNRDPAEVNYLIELLERAFKKDLARFVKIGVRLRFIGSRERVSAHLQGILNEAEEKTRDGTKGTLVIAFSYGGRAEIISAVNKLLMEGKTEVDEAAFKDAMWSAGLLDPDLIIRTGGEQRLSNFLTWQSVYSELFFTDTKWPDFSWEEFSRIIDDFKTRERRHGK